MTEFPPLIILAGGRGTRLGSLTDARPKFLMPVGEGRVFADVQLQWARKVGFEHIVLSIGYLGEQIREHCGRGAEFGLSIDYVDDGDEPLGTGGAVQLAFEDLGLREAAVTYGDTLLKFDVNRSFSEFHTARPSGGLALMTAIESPGAPHTPNVGDHPSGEGRIIYNKKNPDPKWTLMDYGFLWISREAIEGFTSSQSEWNSPLDLSDILSQCSREGHVVGMKVDQLFREIGSPEALQAFLINS